MLPPECNRLSLLINIIWTLSQVSSCSWVSSWAGAKLGGKLGPGLDVAQSSPGDLLGTRKAAREGCEAAGAVLTRGRERQEPQE